MFAISNKSDYALLLVSRLSESEFRPLSKLVTEMNLPERFVARIAADLVKNGVLASREGKIGGYRLAKRLDTITLSQFFGIFEQKVQVVKCSDESYQCRFEGACAHNSFFRGRLQDILWKELDRWTLADIVGNQEHKKTSLRGAQRRSNPIEIASSRLNRDSQ